MAEELRGRPIPSNLLLPSVNGTFIEQFAL